jgi:hypothetical protein
MKNIFLKHPESVGETYFEHMKFAILFSFKMFIGGTACFIHSIFPFVFQKTGSNHLFKMIFDYCKRVPIFDDRMGKLNKLLSEKEGTEKENAQVLEEV